MYKQVYHDDFFNFAIGSMSNFFICFLMVGHLKKESYDITVGLKLL